MLKKIFSFFIIFMISNLFAHDEKHNEPLSLYYWDARAQYGFSNFGDALSEILIERMLDQKIQIVRDPFNSSKKLLGMGSIMNYARDGDVIWGTGVNPDFRGLHP